MSKQAALIGLGRFALNIGKQLSCEIDVIENNHQLCLSIEKNITDSVDFFNNYAIVYKKQNLNNYENAKISTKLNCSSLLFGSVSNYVRREMFEAYRFIEDEFINVHILRIDTDSLMIQFDNYEDFDAFKNFEKKSKFKYKVEMDSIEFLHNNSINSYYYKNNEKTVLKVTGLRLSVSDKNNIKYNLL